MKTRIIVAAVLLPIFFAVLFIFPAYILTIVISVICAIAAYELLCATNTVGKKDVENKADTENDDESSTNKTRKVNSTRRNGNVKNRKRILVYTIIAAVFVPIAVYLSSLPVYAQEAPVMTEGSPINASYNPYSALVLITLLLTIFFFLISLLLIEFFLAFKTEKHVKLRQILFSLLAGMLIPYMLSSLISLKTMPYGHLLVLLPIVSTFMTDSGAYFVGVAFGKRKVFPNISPNKTLEGFIGGIIAGTVGIMIYGIILSYATTLTIMFPALILYGLLGAVVTESGDLVFSLIKRKCDIKDYGRLIPGHGGVLDRFDSMIFNAPLMYLLVMTVPAIFL